MAEVTLVSDQDRLFVGFFPFNILRHIFVHCSDEDDVGRVDDLVKLTVGDHIRAVKIRGNDDAIVPLTVVSMGALSAQTLTGGCERGA